MAKPATKIKPKFKSWSMTRLFDYERCPLYAKLKHLDKLCPKCFKGKIMGGFDTPAVCDTCDADIKKSDALERGTAVGATLEHYVGGKPKAKLHPEIRHPKVKEIAKSLRDGALEPPPSEAIIEEAGEEIIVTVESEISLQFDHQWKYLGREWSPETWVIVKLDALALLPPAAKVIDWKTGGLDKRTGAIRPDPKYQDQLHLYNTGVLSAFESIEVSDSALVFVDCGPKYDPVVKGPTLERAGLKAAQSKWAKRALPLLRDDTFAPCANGLCNYCDYRKAKGGPCRF